MSISSKAVIIFVGIMFLVFGCGAPNQPAPASQPTPTPTQEPVSTPAPTAETEPYQVIEGIRILEGANPSVTIYLPREEDRLDLILFEIYGGWMPEMTAYFVERGYPVVSVTPRGNNYTQELQDCFCALAWAHASLEEYGLDPENLVPVGVSMMGGDVAILGLADDPAPFLVDCPYELPEPPWVQAVIALAGVFDFAFEGDFFAGFFNNASEFMGGSPESNPELWANASAINWIGKNEPPFLLIHGAADVNVDLHQSEIFSAALEEAGGAMQLVVLEGVDHPEIIEDERVFSAMATYLEGLSSRGYPAHNTSTVADIDGNLYRTVLIGDQWWMAESLRVAHSPSGEEITGYCYENDEENCRVYGRLYSWEVAMDGQTIEGSQGICPTGWHLPSEADWLELLNFLGGEEVAGGMMKTTGTHHWRAPNEAATNSSGFSGLPAGGYTPQVDQFEGLGIGVHFWSSTEQGTKAGLPTLHYSHASVLLLVETKELFISVRCVMD
ncbi:FISUMP domain-containing protein [Chloroflexota bacterium]